jgi:multisubunit Na+/H+ antiporter MnhF subunit
MADLQVDVQDPVAEVVATGGLLLVFVAVIGTVMGVTSFALGGNVFATVCCVIALVSFVGSIACFIADGKRLEAAEATLPFPSMLRN